VVGNIASLAIVSGAGLMLAFMKVWYPEWFSVVAWGLAGCALMAVIVAAFAIWTRLPKPVPQVTLENVEVNIRAWIDAFRLGVKSVDEPQSLFTLVVTLDDGLSVLITRPKVLSRYIAIQSSISISPDDKSLFDGLSPDDKAYFALRLSTVVARTGLGSNMDLAQGTITLVRRVPISANLNEGSFMEAVDAVDIAKHGLLRELVLMLMDERKKLSPKPRSGKR
jgi:hypothetical protein